MRHRGIDSIETRLKFDWQTGEVNSYEPRYEHRDIDPVLRQKVEPLRRQYEQAVKHRQWEEAIRLKDRMYAEYSVLEPLIDVTVNVNTGRLLQAYGKNVNAKTLERANREFEIQRMMYRKSLRKGKWNNAERLLKQLIMKYGEIVSTKK